MKSLSSLAFTILVSACSAAAAFAQGDDSCATAQILPAPGVYPFDTTLATTDGAAHTGCTNAFGSVTANNDVWWVYTATSSGLHRFSCCGQASIDTVAAVYDGGTCAAPLLACNDDGCGTQSTVDFFATSGNSYLLRLGAYNAAVHGTGTITLDVVPPPSIQSTLVNPANGHTYHLLTGSSWTLSEQAAVALGGHLVTIGDQAEQDWIVANFHNFQGVDIDIWTGLTDAAAEGTFVWISGQPVTFTLWDLNEPNNSNGNENYCALRQNNPLALWNDLADAPTGFHANPHGLVEIEANPGSAFCAGDGSLADHTTPCPCGNNGAPGNGCGHSFDANGAHLAADGNIPNDDIVLHSSFEPVSSFTLFMQHANAGDTVFHDGVLCAGNPLIRLRGRAAVAGEAFFPNSNFANDSTTTLSARGGTFPGSGATMRYAAWYRNASSTFCPPATANVTNGWVITW